MRDDIAKSLLSTVITNIVSEEEMVDYIKYFQSMAAYKYDDYQQYDAGMRFVENMAIWVNQFDTEDKRIALDFIRYKLFFISVAEINLLAESCFPDKIREILIDKTSRKLKVPNYQLKSITGSNTYKILLRQSLFCGLSDGARMDFFRRANTGVISHEQIYLTYELSKPRLQKMQKELIEDLKTDNLFMPGEEKFKTLFLIDDFSASGTSYLKYDEDQGKLKGKIAGLYDSIFGNNNDEIASEVFDVNDLSIFIILYLCTSQAKFQIEGNFELLEKQYKHKPILIVMHEIKEFYKIDAEQPIYPICNKDKYYDKGLIEDKHTGENVKLGFGQCALPVILGHNTPNNSIPILWSYDYSKKFRGLFPRIPRHRVL